MKSFMRSLWRTYWKKFLIWNLNWVMERLMPLVEAETMTFTPPEYTTVRTDHGSMAELIETMNGGK